MMPFLINGTTWGCVIIDCKNSTLYHVTNFECSKIVIKNKVEKFIGFYNAEKNHHTKLHPIQFWKEIPAITNSVEVVDSGVFVVHCLYSFIRNNKIVVDNFNPTVLRQQLMMEVLEFSDDSLDTEKVAWTKCVSCKRWFHDTCINLVSSIDGDYNCELCKECCFEKNLAGLNND